jgi:hypothetical protein
MTEELDERPARAQLADALTPLCPPAWQIITDERPRDDNGRTRLVLSQRTIDPAGDGARKNLPIGFEATVTVPGGDLEAAENRLDDEILEFVHALTVAHIKWTTATKAIYDGRLGYQLGISINSRKVRAE